MPVFIFNCHNGICRKIFPVYTSLSRLGLSSPSSSINNPGEGDYYDYNQEKGPPQTGFKKFTYR